MEVDKITLLKTRAVHSDFTHTCADQEGFFQRESHFLADEGIQIPLKAGQYRPASETPFKSHFAGVPMMAQQ